jgi:hypothetical protein
VPLLETTPEPQRRHRARLISALYPTLFYDQRRRDVLPRHGIALVELSYTDFVHHYNKRLCRSRPEDLVVIRRALARWLKERT